MINRRRFLATLGAGLAAAVAPWRPIRPAAPAVSTLFNSSADVARAYSEGISIRFVRGFDIQAAQSVHRFDALVGAPALPGAWCDAEVVDDLEEIRV